MWSSVSLLSLLLCSSLQVSLRVDPDQSQFFKYDSVSLSCDPEGTVRRTTSRETRTQCGADWGYLNSRLCEVNRLLPMNTGTYWCESTEGQSSDPVHITVRGEGVVLVVPVLPVSEGQSVSMSCRNTTSIVSATFYRDGTVQSQEPTGHMTIQQVALSDEGLYHCETRGQRSEVSRLRVTPGPTLSPSAETTPPTSKAPPSLERSLLLALLCHLLVLCPYVVSTVLMVSLYRQLGPENKPSVTMATQSDPGLDEDYDDVTTTVHQF